MKIFIEYESSWRNSFLNGSNNEALPKNGRTFIASGTSLNDKKHPEHFINRQITLDTVMGVINRLIGDQRKLYQARKDKKYYFGDMESLVSFHDDSVLTNEMTYIRNVTGSDDPSSFTGMIKTNDAVFTSDYSKEFWGIFALEFEDLISFIINDKPVNIQMELDPIAIRSRYDELKKLKAVENTGKVTQAVEILDSFFPGTNYFNGKHQVVPATVYCSSLYLQLERLSKRFDTSSALTKNGTISGISKRNLTPKDFMNRFTTGAKKKVWGNPYMRKERIQGMGEVVHLMTKASGQLEITIDVNRDKAKEIKRMIENAGVSCFYIGKKGLAYVTDIDTREEKH